MPQIDYRLREPLESPLGRITLSAVVRDGLGMVQRTPRILGSFALVFVLGDGAFYEDSNGVSRDLTAGDLIVVFPDIAHRYGPKAGYRWDEFYIVFDGPLFDLWRQRGMLDASRPIHRLEPIDYWLDRFVGILDPGGDANQSIARLQHVLADALAHQRKGLVGEAGRAWLARACQLLEQGSATDPPLEEVAQALDLSYVGFRKKFTRLAGVSPARHRMRRLIAKACDLIHHRQWTNRQIAEELGFCDEFHFSKRFKQVQGISPADFRARLPR